MEPRHSLLGIASSVIAFLTASFCFLLFLVAAVAGAVNPNLGDPNSPLMVIMGLLLVLAMLINLLGFVLGGVDLFYADRKRLFSILGIGLTTFTFISLVTLVVIGNLVAPPASGAVQPIETHLNNSYQ